MNFKYNQWKQSSYLDFSICPELKHGSQFDCFRFEGWMFPLPFPFLAGFSSCERSWTRSRKATPNESRSTVTGITINLGLSLTKKMVQKDCAPTKGKWYGWIWMPASKVSHVYIVVLEDRNLKIWISKQKRANLNIIMCWWHVWDILSNIV